MECSLTIERGLLATEGKKRIKLCYLQDWTAPPIGSEEKNTCY